LRTGGDAAGSLGDGADRLAFVPARFMLLRGPILDDGVNGWSEPAIETLPEPTLRIAEEVREEEVVDGITQRRYARVGRKGVSALMSLTSFP
jgi:hypothetical protein